MAGTPKSLFYGHYLTALCFFLLFVSAALFLHSRGVLVRDQIIDFGVSRTQISLAFTAAHVAGSVFAPILGYLLDRYSIRMVMMSGALWLGAGFLVMSRVDTVTQFALATAVFVGLGTGTIGTRATARLLVNWFDRHRGLVVGLSIMGASVAGALMPPIAVYLLEAVGWRATYAMFGGICLLLVLPIVAALVRQRPQDMGIGPDGDPLPAAAIATTDGFRSDVPEQPPPGGPAGVAALGAGDESQPRRYGWWRAYVEFARSPAFWAAVLLFGLMSGVAVGLGLHLFLHYTGLGMSDYQAAAILSAAGAFAFAGKPLLGYLIDRWGVWLASFAATVGCAAAMVSLAIASTYTTLLIAGALYGLAFSGIIPLQATLLSRLFEPAAFGRALGSLRFCSFPITAACTPLVGLIYDRTGSYLPAFTIFALFFGIAAALLLRVTASAAYIGQGGNPDDRALPAAPAMKLSVKPAKNR